MLIERKPWVKYTPHEKEVMKTAVMYASDDTPFPPEYAAAYLGKSPSTLQYWRCHRTNHIPYSKSGHAVVYLKKHLSDHLNDCQRLSTAA